MVNWDKIDKKISIKKVIIPSFAVILTFLLIIYFIIIQKYIQKNNFAKEMERIEDLNSKPAFNVEKIYLCSSANAIDNSEDHNLDKLELYQYTDIAIYLNNNKQDGLNLSNTVKKMYIDDIDLQLQNSAGEPYLVYTNLLKMGSNEIPKIESKEKIEFNILNTNEQNLQADYEKPTFYADCSNPISLKYINKLNKIFSMGEDTSATFNGTLLEKAGVSIKDINCRVSFRINIENNDNNFYTSVVAFQIPLNDIFKGTSIKSKTIKGNEYKFFVI